MFRLASAFRRRAVVIVTSLFAAALPASFASPERARPEMTVEERAADYYARGSLSAAIAELRRAVQAHPKQGFYRFMLGNALYRAGRIREAASEYDRCLQVERNFEATMSAGFTRYDLGEAAAAADHFMRAVEDDGASPFARAALAVALYATGDESNAVLQYDQAVRLDSRYSDPASLAIDIRWKPASRTMLSRLKQLSHDNQQKER